MIERAAAGAGLELKVRSHMLRHACGYALANKGHDTRAIQVWLGNRSMLKADRAARIEAERLIDRWNRRLATGRDMLWSPTIRAALIAGTPWLDVFCPGCGT